MTRREQDRRGEYPIVEYADRMLYHELGVELMPLTYLTCKGDLKPVWVSNSSQIIVITSDRIH